MLRNSITQVLSVSGQARPPPEKGHEHFGYLDGVSEPAVEGIVSPLPGQQLIPPGVLLMGQPGDIRANQRPSWAINGSILVYRHLDQLVPEFNAFKLKHHLFPLDLPVEEGAELLGARMVGRWKSGEPFLSLKYVHSKYLGLGAPTDLTPLVDDRELGRDPLRNNLFDFSNVSSRNLAYL